MSLILSLISEIPSVLDEECTCAYCGYFLTASETDICNRCRKDLKRKITETSCNEKLYKITGTKRRTILKEEPWLQQELRTANAEEIKEVSEQKAFLEKYFLQNGVEMKYIDEYCKLKKLTFESFISNLKSKIKKLGNYECNYTDNLIKLFYFRNEGVSPLELIERFQKCLNDKEFLNDQEFLYNYFFQYKVQMEDIVKYCKYEKQINLESFISDLKSKIKKLWDTQYNYSGKRRVKIGVKKLIQLFYLRNEGVSRLKCIELFQNCLDDYLEKFKQCKQECMVNIMRLRDEDIEHVGKKKLRPAKEESHKSYSPNFTSSAPEKVKVNEANLEVTHINEANLEATDELKPAKEESQKSCSPNFTSSAPGKVKVNEANLEVAHINEANLEATNKLRPAKEESQKSCSPNFISSAPGKVKVNEANLEVTHINKANLEATGIKKANLEATDMNETNLEVTYRNEPSNSNNQIFFYYEENASTNNSDDQNDENAFTKKSNASEKLFGPHSVSKNNKIEDEHLFSKLAADFLGMDFSTRQNNSFRKTNIVSKKLADIDNNASEINKNDKFSIARKGDEISVKRTSDITTQKTLSSVCRNDVKDGASSRVISIEQISGNMQKEKKSEDSIENDIRKKGNKNETLLKHDIDAQKIIKNAEISHIASQKKSAVVCKDIKEDVSSKIISVERTDGNIQKERKSGDFSIDNDSRKKDSKKETLLKRDIDAQKIIKNAEISDTALQKESSIVCKHNITEDVSSRIISVQRTDGKIQKERKSGDFSIDNDTRKNDSKKETHLKRDIDAQEIIKNVEISDSKSQKTSIIPVEQTDGNMQKERKSGDFNIYNDIIKKDSENDTLLKHDIDTQKIIKNAEISDTASQKDSSVVCKHDIKEDVSSTIISVERTDGNIQKEKKSGDLSVDDDTRKKDSKKETLLKRDIDAQKIIKNVEISDSKSKKTSIISVEQTDGNMQKERKSRDFNIDSDIRKKDSKNETILKRNIDTQKIIKNAEISDTASQKESSIVCKHDIKEDVSSRIISVEQTDGNIQKKRKLGDFSIDDDTRKKDSKKETLLKRDIDAQKIIKNVEISDSKSQKTSIISVEQTDGNMQKERKSRDFNIDNDIRKKDSKNETILKRNIDTQKIIKNAEISDTASQKESSIVCKHDIKEDVSSRIISVEQTDGNIQKKRKLGDFSIDDDTRKKDSKKETLLKRDIDAQKIIKNVEISDSKSQKTSIISVEQTDGNMQKERKSRDFNIDNDIRKKDSKNETILKRNIDTQKIIKNAEISDTASQKESSIVCKHDIKEDVSSRIISVEQTDGNIQKKRKLGNFSIDDDTRTKDSKKETLLKRDIDAQKIIKNVEISDSKSQKTSIISVEQTDGNMQKERKSGDFNIDNDIRKKDSKKETLLKRGIYIEKIIKNAEISDTASQKESSIVCKHDIKEDVSSRIISVEQTDENRQKKRKREDLKNDLKNKNNASQRLTDIDNNAPESNKNEIFSIARKGAEVSIKRTLDITAQKTPSSVCTNDVKDDASSRIISIEQINRNRQKERKSEDFSMENDIRKKGSKNETHDIDAQKIIKDAEISHIASQKESSVVYKKDIKEDVSSKIISVERTDGNIQKERKSGDFSIDNDIRKKDSKNETVLKRDIDAQEIIKNDEISDSKSQKTSSVVCKNGIKDMSSRVISVEQIDDNIQKERKSEEFNIHNAIRKEGSQNKTLLKYDIDTQKIINNAEISDISQKKSLVVCKHDIKEDMSSRIISVEPTDENRQKRSKREEFNDLKNKNNASQRLTESSKDFQIAACTQPRLATRTDNEDDAQSRIITVSVLCLGDQKEVKISTERNDSKFISDGNEKTLTKIYEFIFNFKKSGSLFKCPYRRTSHSVISGDPTGQSAGPPRIIYRTEISCFLPDKQMPSMKDCIDFLRKNSNEFREYVDKANEKHLLKKFDLRTSAGISEDTDFCEEELRSKKQKERPSILRLFGYEKSEPVELELSDKQEVIKQKISHLFISTPSDDVSHMSKGQSQNSNSGIPFIAHDEHKSIFSEKSKHPDKSREVSSVSQRSPSKDKYDYVPSPDKEEMTELAEKILPCDIDPMVHNKQFFEDVSIEDLLKDFKLDDDLNEAYSSNFLSANIDELCGQNYAKSSHKPESYHDYETASQDSDTFSVYSDFDSVFDSVSPNLLDESLSWDNI